MFGRKKSLARQIAQENRRAQNRQLAGGCLLWIIGSIILAFFLLFGAAL